MMFCFDNHSDYFFKMKYTCTMEHHCLGIVMCVVQRGRSLCDGFRFYCSICCESGEF